MSISLPADFKFVLASLSLIPFVNLFIDISVVNARKLAKVPLPIMFVSPEEAAADPLKNKFNCAQKSSLNFSEHIGSIIVSSLVTGFYAPRLSAALTAAWALGRVIYHLGYSTGDPKKRTRGFIQFIADKSLALSALALSAKAILM